MPSELHVTAKTPSTSWLADFLWFFPVSEMLKEWQSGVPATFWYLQGSTHKQQFDGHKYASFGH